jgi:hypothetical protein
MPSTKKEITMQAKKKTASVGCSIGITAAIKKKIPKRKNKSSGDNVGVVMNEEPKANVVASASASSKMDKIKKQLLLVNNQ